MGHIFYLALTIISITFAMQIRKHHSSTSHETIPDEIPEVLLSEDLHFTHEEPEEQLAGIEIDIDIDIDTRKTIETGESQPPEDPIDNPPEDKIKTEKTPNPCEPRMFNTRDCFGLNGEYMHGF